MKKKKEHSSAPLFAALLAVVVSILWILTHYTYLGKGVLTDVYTIEDPTFCYTAVDGITYFVDSSGMNIAVTDRNLEYSFSIPGGESEDGFYILKSLAADSGGIYVSDKLLDDNGKNVLSERICSYSHDGEFLGYIFEESDDPGQNLYGLTSSDGYLYFVCADETGFDLMIYRESEEVRSVRRYVLEGASDIIGYVNISPELAVTIVTKYGHVIEPVNMTEIYDPGQNLSDDYFSIADEASAFGSGWLINDVGRREIIYTDHSGSSSPFIKLEDLTENIPESFNERPIYSGLVTNSNGTFSFIYKDSYFDTTVGEEIYSYEIYIGDSSGNVLFNGNELKKDSAYRTNEYLTAAMALIGAVAALILIIRAVIALKNYSVDNNIKIQIAILISALLAAALVSFMIVNEYTSWYSREVMDKMANIGVMVSERIEPNDVYALDSPESFGNEAYNRIDETISSVLNNEVNEDSGIYAVMYKVYNDIVCQIYSDDSEHSVFYPMAGGYEGSAEQSIYNSGDYMTFDSHSSAEGAYMFVLVPVFDGDKVIALIEIGTNLYTFNESITNLIVTTLLTVATAVIITILLVSELLLFPDMRRHRKEAVTEKRRIPAYLVRPLCFCLFFAANMSTSFLPVYGMKLWNESIGIPMEIAAAMPLSSELLMAAVSSVLLGQIIDKTGIRPISIAGALLYVIGNICCGLAPNLPFLIVSNGICGLGGGCFAISINTYIASFDDESQRSKGFMGYNAAYLSGMNCGTVFGSVISERFGSSMAFFGAAIVSFIAIFFVFFGIKSAAKPKKAAKSEKGKKEKPGISVIRFIFKKEVLGYFLLLSMPYLICASFLNYFFPVFGEENSLSATQISLAFLVSGVISIYLGPILTDVLGERLGFRKSALLASALYVFAFLIYVLSPGVLTCFVVIAILSAADSFGLTAQSVIYTKIPEVSVLGEGKAMGVSSAFENVANTMGPIVFGGALMLFGYTGGVLAVASVFAGLFLIYVIAGLFSRKKDTSGRGGAKADDVRETAAAVSE
ncbi:MAG: MFS transporter [Oscillospiraceae bacterium]|nr:MFS transporter [Oscillospiraceae bacterium]